MIYITEYNRRERKKYKNKEKGREKKIDRDRE